MYILTQAHLCAIVPVQAYLTRFFQSFWLPHKSEDLVSNEDHCPEMLLALLPVPSPINRKGFMEDLQLNHEVGLDDFIQKDLKHSLLKLPSRNVI